VAVGDGLIDWAAPWLEPWRDLGEPVAGEEATGAGLLPALNRLTRAPVQFVAQSRFAAGVWPMSNSSLKPAGCPTRENLHDFFNALCWMLFPRTKQRLNQLQAAEIAAAGIQAVRGPVRDACTVFDENAALLHAPDRLWDALARREWARLFGEMRPLWRQAQLLVFGHAALEKLVSPYKSITVHVWRVDAPWVDPRTLDAWLADDLKPAKLAAKPPLCPCRCWVCRAGGRPTKIQGSMPIRRSFVPSAGRRRHNNRRARRNSVPDS
jgi:hypothetical protein